jgi:hypothetical protein
MKTHVFLSWSGDESEGIAKALKGWLPDVFDDMDVWLSSHNITPGARWGNELSAHLEASHFGILCLTPENLSSRWILFEAGCLAKVVKDSRVVPYLIGV